MEYPQKEGKHGPIYQIADGIFVTPNEWGIWQVILKRGADRKKKSFGKTEDDRQRGIKAAELLATKLGLTLQKQKGEMTFGNLIEEWYRLNEQRWQPGTQERYQCIIRDFLRPLHNLSLDQVDRTRVKRLLVDLLRIRSANTVEVVHAVISGIFSEAIDLGYSDRNPAYGLLKRILPPKNKRNINEPDPFSRQDLDRFLEAAWSKLPEPFPLILETMAMSGMRLGESLAMSWENLDARNCQYNVSETTRHGRFGPPKSGKRLIDLDATLVAKLENHIKKLKKASLAAGVIPHYLFSGITQRLVQGAVRRACMAAKLRTRSPHDLRHTYATLLLMDHYSPAYVQKQLGHHSISMTVDIYGHWVPGEGKKDLTQTLRVTKSRPGQTLTVVGDNHPQRPQQGNPGVAAHSVCPVGDEVGDKSR
jgi:integrase